MTIAAANEVKKKLGERIRALRQEKRLTGIQLAQACGIRYPYLMNIEKGNHDLTLQDLVNIVTSLETTVSELTEGIG